MMMTNSERDLIISRINVGYLRFKYNGQIYLLRSPDKEQKYLAEEFYQDKLNECYLEGFFNETEYLVFLIERGLWSESKEDRVSKIKTEVEDSKIELFECILKTNTKKKLRLKIKGLLAEFEQLTQQKNAEIHKSAIGLAGIFKLRFLIGTSLFNGSSQVFNIDSFWDLQDCGLLDVAVNFYNQFKLIDSEYRELVRNDPWRTIWACRKSCGDNVFGVSSVDLTDEQKMLVYWSLLYDSVHEHPNCPSQEIIDDDDALDGFLLKEHRQREGNKTAKGIEDTIPESMKKHQEIFIPAETLEDARKIHALNSEISQATIEVRNKKIKEKGLVNEVDLPDIYRRLKMEGTQQMSESIKRK